MPKHTKSFGPNRRVATGSSSRNKPQSKILKKSWREYEKHQALMRQISLADSAKIVNDSVAKGASMSNHGVERTSKGMKQPSASRFKDRCILMEKRKDLSRSTNVVKAKLKEPNAKRKEEVNDASRPTLPGLVPKTTDRLGQYSDSSSRLKKQGSSDKGITSAKYNTTKLELSKGIHMAPKDNYTVKVNDIQDEMVIDNDKENAEKIGLTEINLGQFANFNGKDNNSMSKKRKEPLFEEQVDNMSCKKMKTLKQSRVTRKDEGDCSGDLNQIGLDDDTASILKNDQAKVAMPSCFKQQCYSCSKPIDKPTWSGILKTDDKEYVSLDGHLSTKSCEKAWNLSKKLLKVVEVKKLLRLEVWPKAWEVSTPTGNDIGIYFLPHEMRQDEGLDQLVREVMKNDLALRATIGEAEMLIFPSILLPSHHQTFQGKHYLWGVFKCREDKGVVVEKILNVVGRCEMENQQNVVSDQPNPMLLGEEPNQEMIQMVSVIPLETHMLPPNRSTQEVEASHLKWPTNKGFDLKAPSEKGIHAEVTHAATSPASHEQVNPSMLHSANRLMGFVVRKTPKLDRIIRELEGEGALVFAMQGEMIGAGSWAGGKALLPPKSRDKA